jgi:hypothetical protein
VRLIGTTTVAANGTWSFTPITVLKAGSHSFSAIPQDSQGDFGGSAVPATVQIPASIVIPSTPAAPSITNDSAATIPAGSTTSDNHPHINGTGTAGIRTS